MGGGSSKMVSFWRSTASSGTGRWPVTCDGSRGGPRAQLGVDLARGGGNARWKAAAAPDWTRRMLTWHGEPEFTYLPSLTRNVDIHRHPANIQVLGQTDRIDI